MTPERWQQVKEIFHSALGRAPGERAAFLDEACAGRESLRAEVESLIRAHERSGSFIDSPAYVVAAETLAEREVELKAGQILGPYEIQSLLGRGGMGEVYLAQDKRLGRKVALKLLTSSFTKDGNRLRRFEQEARAASALNHPNIITIHDIGEQDSLHYIATEFVEGETLRDHFSRTVLGPGESLAIGVQIADALSAAHRAGIIHRDIKPENVMLRPDGYVKVLDFGLAKLTERSQQEAVSDSEAATRMHINTEPGMVMGTVNYMSPEQARGLPVDERTDIWSLGAVLYEMVANHAPFQGETPGDVLVSVLEKEPQPLASATSKAWPAEFEWIIKKALSKDREERYQTVKELLGDLRRLKRQHEFEAELERTGTPHANQELAADRMETKPLDARTVVASRTGKIEGATTTFGSFAGKLKSQRNLVWLAVALILLLGGGLALRFGWQRRGATESGTTATSAPLILKRAQATFWSGLDIYPAISPDGNSLAYSSDRNGSFEIYVKQLTPGGRELQITSDGGHNFEPAWSPDGKVLAYHSRNRGGVWVVPAFGGVSRQLTEFGSYPSWSPDGSLIAFQSHSIGDDITSIGSGALPPSTIWTVSAAGGAPQQLTRVGEPPGGHGSPSWSPDGRRIAFGGVGQAGETRVWSVGTRGDELKQIVGMVGSYDPVYSPDGEAIYFAGINTGNNFGLWRVRVSPDTGDPIGEPVEVLDTGPSRIKRVALSANGKKIAYTALNIRSNLWSAPISRTTNEASGEPVALTSDAGYRNTYPDISPDGKRIAYTALRVGVNTDIWLMDSEGKNQAQLTTDPADDQKPVWLPGGSRIAFESWRDGRHSLWVTTPSGGIEKKLLDIEQDWNNVRVSPDGKQLVFHSRKSGPVNVWTVALTGGVPRQLTFDKEGMSFPLWSPDGKFIAMQARRGDDTHIMIMPAGGAEPVQLTSERGQSWPASFSPDGDKIAFAGFRNGAWNVWWVSRSTGAQKQVTTNTKLNTFVRYSLWSPLGDRIVYEYAETTGNVWLIELK